GLLLWGCNKETDEGASSSEPQKTNETDRKNPESSEDSTGAPVVTFDVVRQLEAGGFVHAEDVPFDDMGQVPPALTANTADGQVAARAFVFHKDEAWVQVAVGDFASIEAANAFASAHD